MRTALTLTLAFLSTPLFAAAYDCELKARDNFLQPYETVTGEWDGATNMHLEVKGFTLKVKALRIDGQPTVGFWLGLEQQQSSVTLAPFEQESIYLNHLTNERFAIATCRKRG